MAVLGREGSGLPPTITDIRLKPELQNTPKQELSYKVQVGFGGISDDPAKTRLS